MRAFFFIFLSLAQIILFNTSTKGALAQDVNAKQKRMVALVVGNSTYSHIDPLKNPKNDAQALSAALSRIGYEVVTGIDLNYDQFQASVERFMKIADKADVSLVFYAGHGFQHKKDNHLIPIDFNFSDLSKTQNQKRTINLSNLLNILEKKTTTRILLLDACRNDPNDTMSDVKRFGTSFSGSIRALNSRSTKRGFIPIEEGYSEISGATGTYIAFATAPGKTAFDGEGTNSPFTEALLKFIEKPGLRIVDMMRQVLNAVILKTKINGREQVPWASSSLTDIFYFVPPMSLSRIYGALQTDLKKMQCYEGSVDSNWGRGSQTAIVRFNKDMKKNLTASNPTQDMIGIVRRHADKGLKCTTRFVSLPASTINVVKKPSRASSKRNSYKRQSSNNSSTRKRRPQTVKKRPQRLPPDISGGVGIGGF